MKITHVATATPPGEGDVNCTAAKRTPGSQSMEAPLRRASISVGAPPRLALSRLKPAPSRSIELVKLRDLGGVLNDRQSGKKSAFWIRVGGEPSGHGKGRETEARVVIPDRASRQRTNALARETGLTPHGWNMRHELVPGTRRGKEQLTPKRLYVSREMATVPGTSTELPMRRNILYETAPRDGSSSSMPDEIADITVATRNPGDGPKAKPTDARLADATGVQCLGEVWTFELGDTYLIHVPPGIGKRPVVGLTGHGLEASNLDVPLKPGVTYTNFGPSRHEIVGKPAIDFGESANRYSQHADIDGKHVVIPLAPNAKKAVSEGLTGSSKPLHMAEMSITKFGSITEQRPDGSSNAGWQRDTETARELAFLAHDKNMIVVSVRKGHEGSPNDLLARLEEIGISPREIQIHACRQEAVAHKASDGSNRYTLEDSGINRPPHFTDAND